MSVTKFWELHEAHDEELAELAKTYPNPPCWEHCDRDDHDLAEYVRQEGETWCRRSIGSGPGWSVALEVFHQLALRESEEISALGDGSLMYPPDLIVDWDHDRGITIPLERVPAFAAAIAEAAALCAQLQAPQQ